MEVNFHLPLMPLLCIFKHQLRREYVFSSPRSPAPRETCTPCNLRSLRRSFAIQLWGGRPVPSCPVLSVVLVSSMIIHSSLFRQDAAFAPGGVTACGWVELCALEPRGRFPKPPTLHAFPAIWRVCGHEGKRLHPESYVCMRRDDDTTHRTGQDRQKN